MHDNKKQNVTGDIQPVVWGLLEVASAFQRSPQKLTEKSSSQYMMFQTERREEESHR